MTIPQIVMLNHAAAVNQKRSEERYEWKKKLEEEANKNPVVFNGKKVDELTSEEYMAYWTSGLPSQEG